jgi:GH25 family lysozyme M1 (1,4-beta-N-acetylmuramidase)
MNPKLIAAAAAAFAALAPGAASAQDAHDRPWTLPGPIIVIDPYQANPVDWDQVATDRNVKAVIHRAYHGMTPDSRFVARAAAARAKGLRYGGYLLGKPGDPIRQADALIAVAAATGTKFLALDIENLDPRLSMTLPDAVRFIERIHAKTGRYPALYVNYSTYQHLNANYGPGSVFAKTPLWIARFRNEVGAMNPRIWRDYTFWQFSSEINCKPTTPRCLYRVPGTGRDMDVNIFNGSEADLAALFD